ncbi:MAG: DUF4150 domain-containing protein [Polyangiaceae bacterium]|nr:DUF4150 domain-containing protein [Polyangiaceae bacterium]MBK8937399.1 DUF4150 domain-containing protein [Polyangiaceae bacterium]
MMPASTRGIGMALGFPDVCNTPIPVGTAPIPYPNIADHSCASNTVMNIRINMLDALNQLSEVSMTSGDEAGSAHPTIKGAQRYTLGMINIRFNMMPAITLASLTNHNQMNCPIGAVLVPSAPNVLLNLASAGDGAQPQASVLDGVSARDRADAATPHSTCRSSATDEGATISLDVFALGTAAELAEHVHRATREGARAVTIDLRACRGGVLSAALDAAGLFLPEGTLLATIVDEDGDEREERSRSGLLQGVALTLLVGPATASAAEVFAAALADHGRAELRGERTRGKGALSELVAAPGGLVEVARGQTLRPSGAPLSGRGVVSRERP